MNEKIINERWTYLRNKLKSFQKDYLKANKLTQDKIQEILKSYDISQNNINKTISKVDKQRLLRKIDEWRRKGIVKGHFEYQINDLLNNTIKYKDLTEILLYGTYIEEQESISNEIDTIFNLTSLEIYNQGLKDLKRKPRRSIPRPIDELLQLLIIDGVLWKDYYDALILTNVEELQKKYLISIYQDKPISVYSEDFQRLFEKQRNRLISTSNNKYSGGLDKYATALGNMAYIEASDNKNEKVKFVSDMCDNVTEMCSYMNGMIFNTRGRNIFKRPFGDTQKDLLIQNMNVMGLVIGINQPPITNHFHWCHSTLTYLIDKDVKETMPKRHVINIIKTVKGVNFVDSFIDNDGVYHPIEGLEKIRIPSENSYEFKKAVWIKEQLGGNIDMIPAIETEKGSSITASTSTPDYIWNNEKWDIKTIINATSETRAIDNLIANYEEQAHNFLIDISNSKLPDEIITNQVKNVFRDNKFKRDWVENIYLIKNDEILGRFSK